MTAENVSHYMFFVMCIPNLSRKCSVTLLRLIEENGFIDHLILLVGTHGVFILSFLLICFNGKCYCIKNIVAFGSILPKLVYKQIIT